MLPSVSTAEILRFDFSSLETMDNRGTFFCVCVGGSVFLNIQLGEVGNHYFVMLSLVLINKS